MLHPEFAFLPASLNLPSLGRGRIARPRNSTIGIWARQDDKGQPTFDIWVGRGQGRTPRVARLFVAWPWMIYCPYWMPCCRFIICGRRDNKYKARIKILVDEMGLDAYKAEVLSNLRHG